jgi:[acyl-carrier-protein] S-malonyltransferase
VTASVIGYVDGRPVGRAVLDARLAAARSGYRAGALPAPGSAEDRQFVRWVVQVILTEELCAAEARRRGLTVDGGGAPGLLDRAAAVAHGSITAAAYQNSAAVRVVYAAVTARVTVEDGAVSRYRAATVRPIPTRWVLDHRRDGGRPHRLGPVAAAELPVALAEAVRDARVGDTVHAEDRLGRHRATVLSILPPEPDSDAATAQAHLLDAARRDAFARWLNAARAARVALVPGLEHPGDPRQPDNHHRH